MTPDPDVEVNLYGYQTGTSNYYLPPNIPSVVACEASFNASLSHEPNPGVTEAITFYNASDSNSYNIFFAVAGNSGPLERVAESRGKNASRHRDQADPGNRSQSAENFSTHRMRINISVSYGGERADTPPHRSRYATECLRIILPLEQIHPGGREYEYKSCKQKAEEKFLSAIGDRSREVAHRQREL